jgi:predicted transcriptional regulator
LIGGAVLNIAYYIKPKSAVAYVYSNNTVRQVIEKLKFHGYSAIPVLNLSGDYVGTVTEGDLLWATYGKDNDVYEKTRISSIIRPDRAEPVSIFAQMDELLSKITEQNFVPVVDGRGSFMGIVTRKDIMKYYNRMFSELSVNG